MGEIGSSLKGTSAVFCELVIENAGKECVLQCQAWENGALDVVLSVSAHR